MTVARLRREVSAAEFARWMAFYKVMSEGDE